MYEKCTAYTGRRHLRSELLVFLVYEGLRGHLVLFVSDEALKFGVDG